MSDDQDYFSIHDEISQKAKEQHALEFGYKIPQQKTIKVENEVATARAEAQKTVVEAQARGQQILINAESQAKANKILAESLTTEFVQYQAILKWDGKLPRMTGSNAVPFVNVGSR